MSADLPHVTAAISTHSYGNSGLGEGRNLLPAAVCKRQPEKRKVGSSTLPLTTRSEQAILPSYCGNATLCRAWPLPAGARPRPLETGYGGPLLHADCTARLPADGRLGG